MTETPMNGRVTEKVYEAVDKLRIEMIRAMDKLTDRLDLFAETFPTRLELAAVKSALESKIDGKMETSEQDRHLMRVEMGEIKKLADDTAGKVRLVWGGIVVVGILIPFASSVATHYLFGG